MSTHRTKLVEAPPSVIDENFAREKTRDNFINEHLDTLYELAKECTSIIETGVESVISSWAFARGLRDNGKDTHYLTSIDVNYHPNIYNLRQACKAEGVTFTFRRGSDLDVVLPVSADMVFIDTFHVYEQLRRELERFCSVANKYIAMHDTEVDKVGGEVIRRRWNPFELAKESGYPLAGIMKGLGPALDEFLAVHKEWVIKKHYTHCNGLTVLERVGPTTVANNVIIQP